MIVEKTRRYLVAQCKGDLMGATAAAAMTTALLAHRAGVDVDAVVESIREAHETIAKRAPGGAA